MAAHSGRRQTGTNTSRECGEPTSLSNRGVEAAEHSALEQLLYIRHCACALDLLLVPSPHP